MTHAEFVAAFRAGKVRVDVDRDAARQAVSGRLMLPLVLLPVFGLGVALALAGYPLTGIAIFAGTLGVRFLVHASSQGFILNRALRDAAFYDEMVAKKILRVPILPP
jgi:hypothetical protein